MSWYNKNIFLKDLCVFFKCLCNIHIIYWCGEIDIGNLKTRNFTKLVPVRNLLGFSTWGERETQSFYADCFYIVSSQPNKCAAPVAHTFVWPHSGLNLNYPVRTQERKLTAFSQILAHASGAWRHSHPLSIPIWDFILTSLNDTSSLHACEHLH